MTIDYYDTADLVSLLTEGETVKSDSFYDNMDSVLYEKYGIEFDEFSRLVNDLRKFIVVGEHPITKKVRGDFGEKFDNGGAIRFLFGELE